MGHRYPGTRCAARRSRASAAKDHGGTRQRRHDDAGRTATPDPGRRVCRVRRHRTRRGNAAGERCSKRMSAWQRRAEHLLIYRRSDTGHTRTRTRSPFIRSAGISRRRRVLYVAHEPRSMRGPLSVRSRRTWVITANISRTFIAGFEPAAELELTCPPSAELEWAWHRAFHAPDEDRSGHFRTGTGRCQTKTSNASRFQLPRFGQAADLDVTRYKESGRSISRTGPAITDCRAWMPAVAGC